MGGEVVPPRVGFYGGGSTPKYIGCKWEEGCDKPHGAQGYCNTHYTYLRRKGLLKTVGLAGIRVNIGKNCSVEGCELPAHTRVLCSGHYQRLRKYGDPTAKPKKKFNMGKRGAPGKGGRWPQPSGYIHLAIPMPDGTLWKGSEHKWVMEQHLGRPLTADESVHHKNGFRDDNRIENLELWSRYQPAGQRVEDKLAWAKELLMRYEPESLVGATASTSGWTAVSSA